MNIGVQPVLPGKIGSAAPVSSLGLPAQKSSSSGPEGFGNLLEDASIAQPTADTVSSSSATERSAETKSYGATKGKSDRDQAQPAASLGTSADLAYLPAVQSMPLTPVISTLSLAASPIIVVGQCYQRRVGRRCFFRSRLTFSRRIRGSQSAEYRSRPCFIQRCLSRFACPIPFGDTVGRPSQPRFVAGFAFARFP